jgi:hypothetical protein
MHSHAAFASRLCVALQTLPADVRQYRDRNRQRPCQSSDEAWQVDREALPAVVSNRTHAAIAGARQRLTSSTRSPPAQSDAI